MKKKETARVESNMEIADDIFDMWIETDLAKDAGPGQFLCVYPRDGTAILPRPISICQADREGGRIRIVYRRVGKGTMEFSHYRCGDDIDIMGVLGNGFPLCEAAGRKALLLGGGIGIPPLLELAGRQSGEKRIILGYRDADLFLSDEFAPLGEVFVATQDGSVGTAGNVMDVIAENKLSADVIYACGPMQMLHAVREYALEYGIPAYISLEEHMACGVGACLGCVVKTTQTDEHSHVCNARVCRDGPVFEAATVDI